MSIEANRLLGILSADARKQVLSACLFQHLPVGTNLYRPEEQVRYVYFLTSGLASIVLPMAEGEATELMFVGSEGATGATQLLGPANIQASCFIQLEATGFRMRLTALEKLFHGSEEIRVRLLEFIQHGALTVCQIAGCNRNHPLEGRLARWLLMAQDRTASVQLNFTQEFIAQMLGVQRTTVNAVVGSLSDRGLIETARSRISILDRQGLEAASCSCFPVVHRLWRDLFRIPYTVR